MDQGDKLLETRRITFREFGDIRDFPPTYRLEVYLEEDGRYNLLGRYSEVRKIAILDRIYKQVADKMKGKKIGKVLLSNQRLQSSFFILDFSRGLKREGLIAKIE
jgi:hypothetical protein